ncbi:Hypothetical predicted protein [Olea europaea subsp. europaea]|uniref:Uncharacterized protein n=1 Tax=Olea europaea subsp. europaea TaxID=158383 RepID=A0A8S0QJ38_OLEEU|nr:Hypothetical predicted protein [Olea europaea subsp. europaea]
MSVVNYLEALEQKNLGEKLLKASRLPIAWFPYNTLGKRRNDPNLLVLEFELKAMGAELHYTQRSTPGDLVLHHLFEGYRAWEDRKYMENLELAIAEVAQ